MIKIILFIFEIIIFIGLIISMYEDYFKELLPSFGNIYTPLDYMIGFVANALLIAVLFIAIIFTGCSIFIN